MIELFKNWIYYIFPKRCAICCEVISYRETLCEECEHKIKPLEGKLCVRCGHSLKQCECKRFAYHFRGIAVPFANADSAKQGIYNFKLNKNYDAAKYFGEKMADKVKEVFGGIEFDVVTAIPMYRKKRKFTGFDHAEILATETARNLGIPYKPLLIKTKKNKAQHTLSAKERFENVKGAYIAIRDNSYENVLLIDDIKTTGATLDECARRLMLSGADNVYCATAVITTCKEESSKL